MTYAPPGLRGTFLVLGNDSSFPPVVDGALLFIVNGTTSAPGATGNLIGVYRGNVGTNAWEKFGGPLDSGYLGVQAYCAGQSNTFARVYVAPGPAGWSTMTSSNSLAASDWSPLNVLNAGEGLTIRVQADTLSAAATDAVDLINARMIVWDLDATNLLEVTFGSGGYTHASGTVQPTLTQVQVIGTDLTLVGSNTIESTAGGIYNTYITAEAEWD